MKTNAANPENRLTPEVTPRKQKAATAEAPGSTPFGRVIQSMLGRRGAADQISEEELFAASIFKVIKLQHGADLAQDFKSAFKLALVDKPASERFSSAERAAKEAVQFLVDATILTKKQAKSVLEVASQVCQLDGNAEIWDNIGDSASAGKFTKVASLVDNRISAAVGGESGGSTPAPTTSKSTYAPSSDPNALKQAPRRSRRMKTVG